MAAAVTTRPLPASTTAQTVVQVRPAQMCFEVKEVERLATKVNGAAQFVFKVEFHPPGHPSIEDRDRYTATVPVHAPTTLEALMILQAYGQSIQNKTPQQFREMMDKLAYSAVEIDAADHKGDHQIKFTEYDRKAHQFRANPHINCRLTAQVHQDLERYAAVVDSKATPLGPDAAVHPEVSLERSAPAVIPKITLTQEDGEEEVLHDPAIVASTTSQPAASQPVQRPEEEKKHKINFNRDLIIQALQRPSVIGADVREALEELNELLGDTFADKVQTKGLSAQHLSDSAREALFEKYADTTKRDILLQKLREILDATPSLEQASTEQFTYMVDQAEEWARSS